MKILHLNSLDHGGAASAVKRIDSCLKNKVNSEIFFFKDKSKILRYLLSKPYSVFDKVLSNSKNKIKNMTFSSNMVPFSYIPLLIKIKNPDIIHLHWINAGMISIKDLLKIKKPIVWTMHDYWPFSGGYHYPLDIKLDHYSEDYKIYKIKEEVYSKLKNIKFVAVSKELMEDAKKSSLLRNQQISFINNPLDKNLFNLKNKTECKKEINIDNKFTILFCSNNSIFKKNKNFAFLAEALNKFSQTNNINLIICGEKISVKKNLNLSNKINMIETGYIKSETKLSMIYNAADVTAVPSNKEAFGQVASESCACGTPVIALNNTGLTDIIKHKENGYICEQESVEHFINGLKWIQKQNINLIAEKCQNSIAQFSYDNISNKYIEIYKEILN